MKKRFMDDGHLNGSPKTLVQECNKGGAALYPKGNVWLVNPFDNLPSEGNRAQRYWLMAEAFARTGYHVTYWTSDFSHATKEKRKNILPLENPAITVISIPTLPYKKNVCLRRIISHRKLARDFERLTRGESAPKPDWVIASAPPLGLCAAAMRVARFTGAKFVCDIQDAWPETFARILPQFVWSFLGMRRAAKKLYCGADGVSAVSKRYLELAQAYGSTAPMHLAGHAIDFDAPRKDKATQKHPDGALHLVYAGNMSLSYDLESVIRAVKELPRVTLDIAGNGPDVNRLKALNDALPGPNNIRFWGYLGEDALSELLHRCDVGLIPMFPESCVGVPGKLADYAAAGLRIVESLGGECAEITQKYKVGVHYTAGDIQSLKAALERFAAPTALCTVDNAPQKSNYAAEFAQHFEAKAIMANYVAWCEGITK